MKGIQTTYENMKPYVICMTNLIYIYILYIVTLLHYACVQMSVKIRSPPNWSLVTPNPGGPQVSH